MKLLLSIMGLSVLFFYLAGCGNFHSVYRDFDVDDGSGAMVDIKQRAVIASRQEETKDGITKKKTIVCTEPSPDALSAYAAEIAAEGSVPENVKAAFSAAFQENSAFVGLRTQSIQLLRDSLYRLCEGYMSGALDELQYQTLFRHYQKYMVALLAIEQLTGTVRPPTITINTEGLAETAKSISVMREELSKIDEKISSIEEENNRLNEEKGKKETSNERKDEIVKKVEFNDLKIKSYKKDRNSLSKGIVRASELTARGVASVPAGNVEIPTSKSEMDIQTVAKSVKDIVLKILTSDDTGQLCLAYLIENRKAEEDSETTIFCKQYIREYHGIIDRLFYDQTEQE